ncbi:MAG: hypothetical protein F4056_04400 [Chloroflexi bacterium]|nr:hypothetical protein [Chloroflexota bacterium]
MSGQAAGGGTLRFRAHADAIMEQAAREYRELLREIAASFEPFPEYPGSFFSYGIEVEPPPGGQGEDAPGCVVLGEDGGLYELRIGFEADQLDTDDPATTRSELRVPLEELSPAEYVAYASRAAEAALALLEQGAAGGGS